MVTRDDFFKLKTRKIKKINVKDFGEVYIRSLTEGERATITKKMVEDNETTMLALADERSWVIAYAVCDEKGNRMFTDNEVIDIRDMQGGIIQAIYDEVDKLCSVSLGEENGRIEDTAKNSQTTGGDASQSSSRISLAG